MSGNRNTARWLAVAAAGLAFTAGALDMPQIVSHRGESQDRPENTMAAFRLAFAREVDGVECDVYATTDGVPVIIHDGTTGRTAGSGTNLTVTASSWDDLKDVRVGAYGSWIGTEWEGETLPKFEDYLALLASNNTTKCVVELKGNGANGLIASVVASVQAQPLATKDRVLFIAFDANLIRAVRQALPDYEAWLLLSSGTYTGADLISRIEACNATGVDIDYRATFSDADVAAVKAAGYAFTVWTCDDGATAFALAQKGVDAITTNRGGSMTAYLAAEIPAWDEIYDASLPAGAKCLDAGAYVTNGLVAHFDGIRNAGAALPHDPTATTWKNLVAGGPDATIHSSGGSWKDGKGFYFTGAAKGEYAYLDAAVTLGPFSTVQLAMDVKTSEQSAGTSPSWFPTMLVSPDDKYSVFLPNNSDTKSSTLQFKNDEFVGTKNRPQQGSWAGKYATSVLGDATRGFSRARPTPTRKPEPRTRRFRASGSRGAGPPRDRTTTA